MKFPIYIVSVLFLFLAGCGAPEQVAITQTGNPSQVTMAFAIGKGGTVPAPIQIRSGREFEGEVTSITITAAQIAVQEITLHGKDGALLFRRKPPYVVNLALDSSLVVLDSASAEAGRVFDSVSLMIGTDGDATVLGGKSIVIRGFVNGDSSKSFEFMSNMSILKEFSLTEPFIVNSSRTNRVKMNLDISNWFKSSEGELKDPTDEDAQEEIEESIEESIYGETENEDESK